MASPKMLSYVSLVFAAEVQAERPNLHPGVARRGLVDIRLVDDEQNLNAVLARLIKLVLPAAR